MNFVLPAGVSLVFIHQQLEDNANPCVYSITQMSKLICIIMKIDHNMSLTVQTSLVYLLRKLFIIQKRSKDVSLESGHKPRTEWRRSN